MWKRSWDRRGSGRVGIALASAVCGVLVVAAAGSWNAESARAAGSQVQNVASQAGIADGNVRTFSINTNNFNGDAARDLMIVYHNPQTCCPNPKLYKNNGNGTFTSKPFSTAGDDKHDCTWADVNHDGRQDAFCAVGFGQGSQNDLLMQQADGSFLNQARAKGLNCCTHGRYRTATFVDANDDGWADIFVARYTGPSFGEDGYPGDSWPNQLWINQNGGGSFSLNTSYGVSTTTSTFKDADSCNDGRDFDNDGREDLIFCSSDGFKLYRNTGSSFVDIAAARRLGGRIVDAEWSDFNRDGRLDMVRIGKGQVTVKLQQAGGTFSTSYSRQVDVGINVGVGDINGDGREDVWAVGSCKAGTGQDHPDYLLLNQGSGSFTSTQQPAVGTGCGDSASTNFNYNGDGKDDFVVTNGRRTHGGPIQLFKWTG